MDEKWNAIIAKVTFAYQPIIDIHTKKAIAYEALLREYWIAEFDSIDAFFDAAFYDKILHEVDIMLRKKAIEKLLPVYNLDSSIKLFYNLDNRVVHENNYKIGLTSELLKTLGITQDFITFEVSEKYEFEFFHEIQDIFKNYQKQGYSIAIDDFGAGFSGLQLLYYLDTNYLKIDRFFITHIEQDLKKQILLKHVIAIAKEIGIKVIAEGVETELEYAMCVELGCDYAQGYFIQRPTTNIDVLQLQY